MFNKKMPNSERAMVTVFAGVWAIVLGGLTFLPLYRVWPDVGAVLGILVTGFIFFILLGQANKDYED